ncbi:RadC family protein [Planctobacterium marinum]|uniref:RadC family protein n=1 Tax=Planctobacterium marinum TaxID=1631968 RepID=UPI001E53A0CC|nr:DNA repair protein RadC [Planctobacterium marinum]MCC2606420.1 DNA repair protein RadC [Planctobacterium marinum]
MKMSQWPEAERPREKLLNLGPQSLSDAELLAIFLRTGIPGFNVVDLARQLLAEFGSLKRLMSASHPHFCQAKGLGTAKFVQLQAVLELSRRYFESDPEQKPQFTSSAYTMDFISRRMTHYTQEVFAVLLLDSQHQFLHFQPVFFGTINAAPVYPRELVKLAIAHNAAAVILAHNHPSGISEPSSADRQITQRIVDAMALLDIRVLDHIVVGDGRHTSMAERGML